MNVVGFKVKRRLIKHDGIIGNMHLLEENAIDGGKGMIKKNQKHYQGRIVDDCSMCRGKMHALQ